MKSLASKADYESLLSSYDTWMFDCDGVLWHGDRLIEGAIDVLKYLRSQSALPLCDAWQIQLILGGRKEYYFCDE